MIYLFNNLFKKKIFNELKILEFARFLSIIQIQNKFLSIFHFLNMTIIEAETKEIYIEKKINGRFRY